MAWSFDDSFVGQATRVCLDTHPSGSPEDREFFDYLISVPSLFSPTERWVAFRDDLMRDADWKDNRKFIREAELVLAYRATVLPEGRFWRADGQPPPTPPTPEQMAEVEGSYKRFVRDVLTPPPLASDSASG